MTLPGIGPKTKEKLEAIGLFKNSDLLYYFPHRYLDFSNISSIKNLRPNQNFSFQGKIISFKNIFIRNGKSMQKILVADNSGQINLTYFNQSYLSQKYRVGESFAFAGTPSLYKNQLTVFNPLSGPFNTNKIIPIYPETARLKSNWFRKIIGLNFNKLSESLSDPIPQSFLKKYQLLTLKEALENIHFPKNKNSLFQAQQRLRLDEFFAIFSQKIPEHKTQNQLKDYSSASVIKHFPFTLSPSQKIAWEEIKKDLLSEVAANRLLVGEVGSGKTVIALLASNLVSQNHLGTLFLAPTEILSQQHLKTFKQFLPETPVYLLTNKNKLPKNMPKNSVVIATHAALFSAHPFFQNLGLVIIDEQHKFGVKQRNFFNQNHQIHTLTLSATPIPRSLNLALFGHLSLSRLEAIPKKSPPIKTFIVPQNKINDCYHWLEKDIVNRGTQAFILCPFIEESESITGIKAATTEFASLQKIFPKLKLALIHGKTPSQDRQKILHSFSENKINILVTTPIIEVGIDFPNATTIIIQSAERFGLSQLHQLRGRVGRGSLQSYCYLFSDENNLEAQKRLRLLASTLDGFKIAGYDLKIRGPGEFFSTLQHGFPSLKLADITSNSQVSEAENLYKQLIKEYPDFDTKKLHQNQHSPKKILLS